MCEWWQGPAAGVPDSAREGGAMHAAGLHLRLREREVLCLRRDGRGGLCGTDLGPQFKFK